MDGQRTDFGRLLRLQRAVKAVCERDLSDARNRVASAEQSIRELQRALSGGNPVLDLFPDLVARRLENTMIEKADAERHAGEAGRKLLREKKKLEAIEERHAEQRATDARAGENAAQSETIDQRLARYLSASSKIGGIG